MQWLIDLIVERIRSDGMFVDRGDPAAWDFLAGDFIRNGNWHDLDLSDIVPTGAHAVLVQYAMSVTTINKYWQLRRRGNSNPVNHSEIRSQVANQTISIDGIVPIGPNRFIQYRASPGTYNSMAFIVKGWWY